MDSVGWRRQIGKALDAGAVLRVVSAFMGSLTPAEAAALPPELRSSPPKTAEDVSYWALLLTRTWLESGSGGSSGILTVGRVSLVYADASRRLAEFGQKRVALWHP